MPHSEARAETALVLVAIALSGLFLFEGAKLKPGVFEPIGPGAVPMGVAVITIVLSLLVLIGRWRTSALAKAREAGADSGEPRHAQAENWPLMLAVSVLTLVYAGALQAGVARYGAVTVVYLVVAMLLVSGRVRRDLPWAAALALGFGLGLDYVFRHLLVADLP